MCSALVWFIDAVTSVSWLEAIKVIAPVVTAFIAYLALRNWQRQDKAKREAEFLDAMIEAVHAYIAEMPTAITVLEMAKIGMASHAPTWEGGDEADIAVKGSIAYIEKYGEGSATHLHDAMEAVRPSVIKLRSLESSSDRSPQKGKFSGSRATRDAITQWRCSRGISTE